MKRPEAGQDSLEPGAPLLRHARERAAEISARTHALHTASRQLSRRAQSIQENARSMHWRAGQTRANGQGVPDAPASVPPRHTVRLARGKASPRLRSKAQKARPPGGPSKRRSESGAASEQRTAGAAPGSGFSVVAIGASAGGFEAFNVILSQLPNDTGMAFVLVQHLDPAHQSKLTELLSRSSSMPVREIKHGMKVEPNHVFVMPENAALVVSEGRLLLSPRLSKAGMPPMPIDQFFRSLASEFQNRAVGVILSGTGTDGTLGMQAIKGEGGITLAQNEATAKYFGMPGSAIAANCVDFVLSPEGIAKELVRIARHPYMARPVRAIPPVRVEPEEEGATTEGQEFTQIFALLRARTGVDFSLYKPTTLRRRIARRMVLHKGTSLSAYVRQLRENPAEVDALFNDLLINVTGFFRDPRAFQALRRRVFPKLTSERPPDSPLRFWVVGSSTGEEAYSLAICLTEFFEQSHNVWPVQIFGTDISEAAVEKARAGVYPENISLDVSPERLRRFFVKTQGHYQVSKTIRDMCIFARQNVTVDPPFSNLDLVSCRNVLIYLGPALQKKIIPVFHYALRPHGYLMLGTSETIGTSSDLFTLVDKKNKIYSRKETALRPLVAFGHRKYETHHEPPAAPTPGPAVPEAHVPDLHQQVDRLLLNRYSPAAVVVNSDLEVLQFRGRTGYYLEHPPGAASLSLLKMAREGLAMDLRTAVSRAMKHQVPVRQEGARVRYNGHTREVTVEVVPFRLTAAGDQFYLILFQEHTSRPEDAGSAPKARRGHDAVDRRELTSLREELAATKESLQAIIEEQEATNEELKSANEEIQSSNEELQSTNEELETAKEELQSTNEELTTLNEELQTRNNELSQVNNDLTNLLSSVNIAVIMLGNDLTVRRFTPMAERIFNLIPSDIGRRLTDLNRTIVVADLDRIIQDVIDNLTVIEREVQDRDGRWYSLRVRPYRTQENKIEGAVILLVDIDEHRRAIEDVMALVKQPLLALSPDLRVRKANDAFYQTFQLQPGEVEDRIIFEIGQRQWDQPPLRSLFEEVLPRQNRLENFRIEVDLPPIGPHAVLVSARKFTPESRGVALILLALESLPTAP